MIELIAVLSLVSIVLGTFKAFKMIRKDQENLILIFKK